MYLLPILTTAAGSGLGFLAYKLYKASVRRIAESEAEEILQEVKDQRELQLLDEKEKLQHLEEELWSKEESFIQKLEEKIEDLEEEHQDRKKKLDDNYSQERQKTVEYEKAIEKNEDRIKSYEQKYQSLKGNLTQQKKNIVEKLISVSSASVDEIKAEIAQQLQIETDRRAQQLAQEIEEDAKEHSETHAKKILATALDRFARAYSSERGIAPVYYPTPEARTIVFDKDGKNQQLLQELLGCDIVVSDDMDMIGVAGFDPVRRELARRVLERLVKEKKPISQDLIKKIAENQKRELLRQIKNDGDRLAQELGLKELHPEIRQVMGSLRYRYSFTQNQYFHCGEVGWLAGLLASELRTVHIKKAARAGMLHDLGKAMDHELDGGHAVIGADFIKQRGEGPEIVHAVRAHHYDEQPSTDMAFLVIAADAISGARPGARRSTIESYNQKVNDLENIALSFEGVLDCYILSGGRECRVIADGRKVNDQKALLLSKDIAARIEAEMSYPGHIKVVVVRETLAYETTRGHDR